MPKLRAREHFCFYSSGSSVSAYTLEYLNCKPVKAACCCSVCQLVSAYMEIIGSDRLTGLSGCLSLQSSAVPCMKLQSSSVVFNTKIN